MKHVQFVRQIALRKKNCQSEEKIVKLRQR